MAWPTTSRHARGYGSDWVRLRREIIERDGGLCVPCGRKGETRLGTEVHHKVPKSKGGTDDPSNLELTCHACHEQADAEAQGRSAPRRPAHVAIDGTISDA